MNDRLPTPVRAASIPIRVGLCAMLAAAILPSQVQEPQGSEPRVAVDEARGTMSFSMQGDMDLLEFVKWAQAVSKKRLTYRPEDLRRAGDPTVSLLGTFRFDRQRFAEQFGSLLQTVLYIKGFAVVPHGVGDTETLEIVPLAAHAEPKAPVDGAAGARPKVEVDQAADSVTFSIGDGGTMHLIDFVTWAQEITGKRFAFRRQELQRGDDGDHTIRLRGAFTLPRKRFAEDFFVFFQTMLFTRGFAVVSRGDAQLGLYEIVRVDGKTER